jgi:hypothetical protein
LRKCLIGRYGRAVSRRFVDDKVGPRAQIPLAESGIVIPPLRACFMRDSALSYGLESIDLSRCTIEKVYQISGRRREMLSRRVWSMNRKQDHFHLK